MSADKGRLIFYVEQLLEIRTIISSVSRHSDRVQVIEVSISTHIRQCPHRVAAQCSSLPIDE